MIVICGARLTFPFRITDLRDAAKFCLVTRVPRSCPKAPSENIWHCWQILHVELLESTTEGAEGGEALQRVRNCCSVNTRS